MIDYVDLVLVRHFSSPSLFLFQAPGFSGIEKGDVVFCETIYGDCWLSYGMVMAVDTCAEGSSPFNMAVISNNAVLPLKKILKYGNIRTIEWEDSKKKEDGNGTD